MTNRIKHYMWITATLLLTQTSLTHAETARENSAINASATISYLAACTPVTPTGLTPEEIGMNTVFVTWYNNESTSFKLQYRKTSSSTWTTVTSTSAWKMITGLSAGTNYQIKISGVCANGNTSAYSSVVNFSTKPPCTAVAPTNLTAGNITHNSVKLTWSAVANATYKIEYRQEFPPITSLGASTTVYSNTNSITINNLNSNGNYWFRVRSICDDGYNVESEDFDVVSIVTLPEPCNPPLAPTSLTVEPISPTSVKAIWSGSLAGVVTHELQYRLATASTWTTVTTSGVTSKTLTNLTAASAYQFRVRSVCSTGGTPSSYTNVVNCNTPVANSAYCTTQGNIQTDEYIGRVQFNTIDKSSGASAYSNYTGTSTTIKKGTTYALKVTPVWTGSPFHEDCIVWIDYNKNNTFENSEKVMAVIKTTNSVISANVTIPTSATNGTTRMRVRLSYTSLPISPCGNFEYGEIEDYTVNIVNANGSAKMDGEELVAADKISAYPNPTEDSIFFTSADQINHVDVFNMLGEKVYSSKGTDHVDVSNFTNGLYIVKLQLTDNSEQVLKIVKK